MLTWKELLDACRATSTAQTQEEMSALMGKRPSYCSSQKAKGKAPSLDGMAHLHTRLSELENEFHDLIAYGFDASESRKVAYQRIAHFRDGVFRDITARCRSSKEGEE